MITNPLAPGSVTSAEYIDQDVSAFRGNPFLEALPPLLSGDELRRRMAYYPSYDPAVRERPPEIRRMEAGGLLYYRHPVGVHLEMAFRLTNLLRWGYVARNPIHPGFQAGADGDPLRRSVANVSCTAPEHRDRAAQAVLSALSCARGRIPGHGC